MENLIALLSDSLPSLLTGGIGLAVGIVIYLSKRIKYKTEIVEAEIQKVELEKIIAAGSYLICPGCGKKIFISDAKIYTGGVKEDENKI